MINCKAKGSRLELKSMKLLQASGYQCIKSAASLGVFDIIATNRLGIRCLQVKANNWPGPSERENMKEAARSLPVNATIECWRWDDNARQPLIKHIDEFK
ncbi:MAG: hypothetical protein JEZ07_08800 [Phycisphaerae bacterium]|nr:hypothetical protein [Phycisphaerae bacterium]